MQKFYNNIKKLQANMLNTNSTTSTQQVFPPKKTTKMILFQPMLAKNYIAPLRNGTRNKTKKLFLFNSTYTHIFV